MERIKKQIKPSVKNDRGLRVLINLTSLKNFTEFNKLILSSKLNSFCLKNNILLLCQFDMSQLTSTDLLEILKTHRYIIESDEVVNNNFYSNPAEHLSQIRIEREKIHLLSNREIKILKLIVNGLSSKKISEELNISHRTVDTHRLSIMKKLDLNSVVDLVKFSLRNGLA